MRRWPVVLLRALVAVVGVLVPAALSPGLHVIDGPDLLRLPAVAATLLAGWLVVRHTRPPPETVPSPDGAGSALGVAVVVLAFVTTAAASDLVVRRAGGDPDGLRTFGDPVWAAVAVVLLAGVIVLRELRRELRVREGPMPDPAAAEPRGRPRGEDEEPWPVPGPADAAADLAAAGSAAFAVTDLYPGRRRSRQVFWVLVAAVVATVVGLLSLPVVLVVWALVLPAAVLAAGLRRTGTRPHYRPRSWRWITETEPPVPDPPQVADGGTALVDPQLLDRDALRICAALRRAGPVAPRYLRDALELSTRTQAALLVALVESGHVRIVRADEARGAGKPGHVALTGRGGTATARHLAALASSADPPGVGRASGRPGGR